MLWDTMHINNPVNSAMAKAIKAPTDLADLTDMNHITSRIATA